MAEQEQVEQPTPEPEPEPENPDAEPEEEPLGEPAEPEPEPEPEPHEPSSQTVLDQRARNLEGETRRHEKALRKIYGDDFETLAVCPLCLSDGYIIPAPPGAMPPEQWEAVQLAAGQLAEENYREADFAETCPTCDGWGKVLSGSKDPTHRTIPCRPCEGKGWKAKLGEPAPLPTFTLPAPPPPNGAASIDWTRPRDQWGRPEGHPHFGMEPSLVGIV